MKILYNKGEIILFKFAAGVLLLLISHTSLSQNFPKGLPFTENYQKSDYGAGTQNWSIVQGKQGIMYFANNEGMLEFDGTNWRKHVLPNRTVVRSLAIGENEDIYVGGQGEFGFFSPDSNGALTYHSLVDKIPASDRNFEDVWRILNTSQGVFFNTFKAIYQYQNGKISVFKPEQKFGYLFKAHDKIYVGDYNNGILLFNGEAFKVVENLQKLKGIEIVSMLEGDKKEVIIITRNQGLYRLIGSELALWEIEINDTFKNSGAYSAIKLRNSNYVIGTSTDGLIVLDSFGTLVLHLSKNRGLENRTVLSLYEDDTQNLWAGLGNGIAYIEINSPLTLIDEKLGVLGAGYTAIIMDSTLYLGTNQAVFTTNIHNTQIKSPGSQLFKNIVGSEGQTWSTTVLGNKLILGQHDGASVLSNNSLKKISDIQGAWQFVKLNNRRNYMLGGHYKGLVLYKNLGTDQATDWVFQHNIKGFDESSRVIVQDNNSTNTFWIAHAYKGIYKVILNNTLDSVTQVKLYDSKHGLPSNISNNVFKIKNKILFAGEKNMFTYDPITDRFVLDTYWNSLLGTGSSTNKLVEDNRGNVWFAIDKKVGKLSFSKNRKEVIKQTILEKLNGKLMPGFEHIYPCKNGDVIFGTDEGFVYYNPSNTKPITKTYKTLLRNIKITGQVDSTIYHGYQTNSTTKLSATLNNLKFSYSAIFYESPKKTKYKYYLEGFENKWSKWSNSTEKEYTNLPNGKYIFHVKSNNIYNHESQEANYTFEILPPWYLSNYAYIAYAIVGLAFLLGIDAISKKSHHKEKEALRQDQRKALKKKEKEFNKIRKKKEREIIKLTNDKLEADIVHKNKELATTTMQVIHKNEFLIQLKDKLQGLSNGLKTKNTYKELSQLIKSIDSDIVHDVDWKKFEVYFDETHEGFLGKIRDQYPKLSPKDLKLCSYLRMNLTTKEIAPLMNISVRGVEIARYRLRKKLKINDNKIDLIDFILKI